MAVVQNAANTKIAKGNREQLEAAIYNIDPSDTPLFSLAEQKKTGGVTWDFQTENLPDANLIGGQVEGYINENSAPVMTVRHSATTMLSKVDATVTGDQQAADAAGKPEGEMAHQMALKGKALRIHMDKYLSGKQARVDDNGTVGSVTEGFEHALKTNVSRGAGGASASTAYTAVTAGTARPLTEDLFDDVCELAYENGAKPSWVLVGGHQKRVISKFAGRANGRFDGKVNELYLGGVTLLISDFGDFKVALGRNHTKSSVLIVDPTYVKKVFYRPLNKYDVAKVGDADTKVLQARWGVQVSNEAAHALIADLTTAF